MPVEPIRDVPALATVDRQWVGSRPVMTRAIWNGVVLAETSRPVLLEGNVYFPPDDVRPEYLARTRAWSVCPWKGLARYYTVRAGGAENKNAAWYYPHPSPLARKIKNHVAFWHGVQVDSGTVSHDRPEPGVTSGPGPEPAAGPEPRSGTQG